MTQSLHANELNGILTVGQTVLYFPEPARDHRDSRKAHIQGWRPGQFISLDLIFDSPRSVLLRQGALSSVRFVHDGKIHAFSATTLDSRAEPRDPTFRVAWPESVNVLQLRKHQRVSVSIKCSVTLGDAQCDGLIEDLSAGGVRVWIPLSAEAGQRLHCTFTLPDGAVIEKAACDVKNAERSRDGFLAGCAFDALDPKAKEEIDFYIAMSMAASRADESPEKLLFIGTEFAAIQPFLDRLRQDGYIVSTASGAIEGFAKLRSVRPAVVFLGSSQQDLGAEAMHEIIRNTAAFSVMPILSYGGAQAHGSDAQNPEIEGHLPSLSDAEAALGEVRRLLKR